jgi:pSer/pThr/pTyr-binding forkhead associated (FHA) protein
VIVCPRCSKENQDHYKFCLGCGAELPRNAAHQPKAFTAPTPPAGMPATQAAPAVAPASVARPSAPAAPDAPTQLAPAAPVVEPRRSFEPAPAPVQPSVESLTCPKCSASVPKSFKFCGSCGHPMASVAAAAPAPAPAPAPVAPSAGPTSRGSLVLIRPDGSEGESIPLTDTTLIGREVGGVFAADLYLSPRHATLTFEGSQLFVRDEDSLNGVYVRIDRDAPWELRDGAIFRIGQELLRFNTIEPPTPGPDGVEVMGSPNPGFVGRLSLIVGRNTTANSFPIPAQGLHLGRERGDLIFPEDGYVSGLHARIHSEQGRVFLTDVGSSNGTFVRVVGKQAVRSGDLLLMGQQLFRAEY